MNKLIMKKRTIRESISGKFVPLKDSEAEKESVVRSDNFERAYRSKCKRCGSLAISDSLNFDCPECGLLFEEEEDYEEGFRLIKGEIGEFKNYKVSIVENPHIFYKKKKPDPLQKYILFSDTDEEEFDFIDDAGQFVVLDIDRIDLLENDEELEEVIEKLKDKRRQLVDFTKLDTDEREFQDLMCRLLDRNPNFEVEFSGAEGTDGGMDGLIHYVGGMNPKQVLLQCKRNTSGSLSPQNVIEERNKIDGNHDASMLLLACMSVSRNVRDQQKKGKFTNHNVDEVAIWQREDILNELCEYPYLIREFFYGAGEV